MSCHKAIVGITGRAHCFHDCIYITPIFILWHLSTLCIVNDLWPLMLPSLFSFLSTLWFIGTSNVWPYIMFRSAGVVKKPGGYNRDNWEGTLFSWLHICYVYLASGRFWDSICPGSLLITHLFYMYEYVHNYFKTWKCLYMFFQMKTLTFPLNYNSAFDNDMFSLLSERWLCGNSCFWDSDVEFKNVHHAVWW